MVYRTKTYIAADWDNDILAVNKIYEWNDDPFRKLNFVNAHDFHQSRDTSNYCSIKKSLSERLDMSKTFVLIVGKHTKNLTKGSCKLCRNYDFCSYYNETSNKSYIEFECDKAARDGLKIVVIYNSSTVDRTLCPESVRFLGTHLPLYVPGTYCRVFNYQSIKNAII